MQSSPEVDPVAALQRLTRSFVNLATQTAEAQAGVSLPQMRLLLTVASNPGASSAEIGHEMAVSASAVSRMADRLVEAGLLDRTGQPGNRRVVVLELTSHGRERVQAVLGRRAELFADALTQLGADAEIDAETVARCADLLAPALTRALAAETAK